MRGDSRPKSREYDIVQQEADNELLVYDLTNDKAFCLNPMSAKVWQLCDGSRTVDQIGTTIGSDDIAKLAIDQLIAENLIEGSAGDQRFFPGMSRRKAVMRIAAASMVAIPVIATVMVPQSVYAQTSLVAIGGMCSTSSQCVPNNMNIMCCRNSVCENGNANGCA